MRISPDKATSSSTVFGHELCANIQMKRENQHQSQQHRTSSGQNGSILKDKFCVFKFIFSQVRQLLSERKYEIIKKPIALLAIDFKVKRSWLHSDI